MDYKVTIKETNGEQEYYNDFIIEAVDLKKAQEMAEKEAKKWYGGEGVKHDYNIYWFLDGVVAVMVEGVEETNAKKYYNQHKRNYRIWYLKP